MEIKIQKLKFENDRDFKYCLQIGDLEKIKITPKEYTMLNNIINRVKRQGGFEE